MEELIQKKKFWCDRYFSTVAGNNIFILRNDPNLDPDMALRQLGTQEIGNFRSTRVEPLLESLDTREYSARTDVILSFFE